MALCILRAPALSLFAQELVGAVGIHRRIKQLESRKIGLQRDF
jgi:hypothetical protein